MEDAEGVGEVAREGRWRKHEGGVAHVQGGHGEGEGETGEGIGEDS